MNYIQEINGTTNDFCTYEVKEVDGVFHFTNKNILVTMNSKELFDFMLDVKLVGGVTLDSGNTYRTSRQLIAVEEEGVLKLITLEDWRKVENRIFLNENMVGNTVRLGRNYGSAKYLGKFFQSNPYSINQEEYYAFELNDRLFLSKNPRVLSIIDDERIPEGKAFEIFVEKVKEKLIAIGKDPENSLFKRDIKIPSSVVYNFSNEITVDSFYDKRLFSTIEYFFSKRKIVIKEN